MIENLNETVEMMNSSDYKERFKAEYYQLEYRYNKLKKMLEDWDNSKLSFIPTCDRDVYTTQIVSMGVYLNVLKQRAGIEGIEV